jgi:hypothetical protein
MWILKPKENEFQVTREGEFEYCRFQHGIIYDRIPSEEADRFEPFKGKAGKPGSLPGGGEPE